MALDNSSKIDFAEAFRARTKKFVVDNIRFLELYLRQKMQK